MQIGSGAIAFIPKTNILAFEQPDGLVNTIDPRMGQVARPLLQASAGSAMISFSPDGQSLALSQGGTSSLWDVASGQREGIFPNQYTGPAAVFDSAGDLVVSYEGSASNWPVDVSSWERFACQVAGRDLSQEEWSQLLPYRPYQRVCP